MCVVAASINPCTGIAETLFHRTIAAVVVVGGIWVPIWAGICVPICGVIWGGICVPICVPICGVIWGGICVPMCGVIWGGICVPICGVIWDAAVGGGAGEAPGIALSRGSNRE